MKLSQLASKPNLVKITIDDEKIVQSYGEPVEFYTWDRQPIDVFMKLVTASTDQKNIAHMVEVLRALILDEQGIPVIKGNDMIPTDLLIEAMGKIIQLLGK